MKNYVKYIRDRVGSDRIIMVGGGVYVYKDGKTLLQMRKDNGCWGNHGGYMEMGETTEETARRELFEETGLVAGEMQMLGTFSGPELFYTYPNGDQICLVDVVYICQDFSGEMHEENNEVAELRWFGIDDIPANFSPPNKKALAAFVEWAKNQN